MLKKKDKLYYARILPNSFTFDVCELIIRTVTDEWFVGIDKHDKHAYLFSNNEIGEIYKSYSNYGFTETAGYNSDETFKNALIEFGQQHHSKGFDILMLAFEGYPIHQIQDLYELSDEEQKDRICCPYCNRFPFISEEIQIEEIVRIICFKRGE